MNTIYKALVLNAVLIASSAEAGSLYRCTEQNLVQRETKRGYSIGLTNVPAKDADSIYLLDGKQIRQDEAVKYATATMKPIFKARSK